MKVTRLKRGYAIRLSDSEYATLRVLVQHGKSDMEGDALGQFMEPLEIRGWKAAFNCMDPLAVTDDRRGA